MRWNSARLWRRVGALAVVVAAAGALGQGDARGVDSGLVYFAVYGTTSRSLETMSPDGSAKTVLTTWESQGSGDGPPSRLLHGGHRWLLEVDQIPGETYSDGTTVRREWFAIRDDGAVVVRLTDQADLAPEARACWSPGDASFTWSARRWVGGVAGTKHLYVAPVAFDGNGDVAGLSYQPAGPVSSIAGASNFDWSPDGTRIVVSDEASALWLADPVTGAATAITTTTTTTVKKKTVTVTTQVTGGEPAWSPDGARIAYSKSGAILTMLPDGTGQATVVAAAGGGQGMPRWSPTGSDLVFLRLSSSNPSNQRYDVYRVAAAGGAVTNLTADLDTRPVGNGGDGQAFPLGWR